MSDPGEPSGNKARDGGPPPRTGPDGSAVGPGRWIRRFRLERELGRGGMGIVYLARDTTLDRPVGINVVVNWFEELERLVTPEPDG